MATKKSPSAKQLAARNPARKPRKAKGVTRPSQATGKRPSARLVKRRKLTKRAPAGFFANPLNTKLTDPQSFGVYRVDARGLPVEHLATFFKKAPAVQYGQALARSKRIRVGIVGHK